MRRRGEEWLRLASIDLGTIARIADDDLLTPPAAFHSQQCMEKSFKAILAAKAAAVPRPDDLVALYGIVE